MAIIKVLAGDLKKGQQRIDPKWVKNAELQTEESLKKLSGSAGWGFTGAIVGGLLTGGIGLLVGGLAGVLSGGNKTEICFSCELDDGRKFLAITDKKTWQSILAGLFQKNQENSSTQLVFEEQLVREEREHKSEPEKVEELPNTLLMLQSEVDEVRRFLEPALAQYNVKLQVSQAKNQLNIVVNRSTESLVDYLELTTNIENELEVIKLKGLKFNGVDRFKFIGRVAGSTQSEWQKILYSDNEVSSSFRQSPNSDSTSTEIKHGASKDFKSVEEGKTYAEFQAKALVILSRFWKWYISGFASRPDKAIYESPRFYRIVLTFLFFSGWNPLTLILFPFLPKDTVSNSSSSPVTAIRTKSESSSSSSTTKAGSTICINNFNQKMSPLASATFDSSNQTMNVYVSREVTTQQDAEKIADAMADATFSSCDLIKALKVEINGFDGYLTRTNP